MTWFDGAVAQIRRHPIIALGAGAGIVGGLAVALTRAPTRVERSTDYDEVPTADAPVEIRRYLARARDISGFDPAFVPFGVAAAWRESKFNPSARRTTQAEVDASCKGYENATSLYGVGREDEFCTGAWGWWQFHPSTGMKPQPFRQLDPRIYLLQPAAQTAMFADFVNRIVRDYLPELPLGERTYLSVRRAMAGLGVMRAWDEDQSTKAGRRARAVRERLDHDYQATGADPDLMWVEPQVGGYPGAGAVWQGLKEQLA